MPLTGDGGVEIDSIVCEPVDTVVITRDDVGNQAMTTFSRTVRLDHLDLAPVDCPLINAPIGRGVGDFAVCVSCLNSFVYPGNAAEV